MKDDDPLHERLQAWTDTPKIPPSFHADVWAGIRMQEEARTDTGLAAFLRWLFPAPAVWQLATVSAVVMLVLGASLGNLKADAANDEHRALLAQQYAQSIDPYLQLTRHAP